MSWVWGLVRASERVCCLQCFESSTPGEGVVCPPLSGRVYGGRPFHFVLRCSGSASCVTQLPQNNALHRQIAEPTVQLVSACRLHLLCLALPVSVADLTPP